MNNANVSTASLQSRLVLLLNKACHMQLTVCAFCGKPWVHCVPAYMPPWSCARTVPALPRHVSGTVPAWPAPWLSSC